MLSLMRGITLAITLLVGMTATALAQENKDGRDRLGAVSRIQGEAIATYNREERPLKQGDAVYQDDTLRTGNNSRLLVRLTDGSDLTLGAEAAMLLSDVIASPRAEPGPAISLLRGAFALAAAKTKGAQIVTPVATIGIRGTQLWGGPLAGALDVLLFEGKIDVRTSAGTVTLDQPGQGTVISGPGQDPGPVGRWSEDKVKQAIATVAFQ